MIAPSYANKLTHRCPKFPIKQAFQKVDLEEASSNECCWFKHCLMDCSLAHFVINCNIIIALFKDINELHQINLYLWLTRLHKKRDLDPLEFHARILWQRIKKGGTGLELPKQIFGNFKSQDLLACCFLVVM
jgi:hypothetical protein